MKQFDPRARSVALSFALSFAVLIAPLLGCGLGGLLDREDDVTRLLAEEAITDVVVSGRDGQAYVWEGRRDWTRCSGTLTFRDAFGDGHETTSTCGLPLPLPELEAGCDAEDAVACHMAAVQLRDIEPLDAIRMTSFAQRACDRGQAEECFYLGVAYASGDRGLPENPGLALANYTRACDARVGVACMNAGIMRYGGDGAEAQHDVACDFFRRGCEFEHDGSCGELGQCHRDGEGVPRDYARARQLLERACTAQVGISCTNLGNMYAEGEGMPADGARAHQYYVQGCERNNTRGCRLAAVGLLNGSAGLPNRRDGAGQLERLCAGGDRSSCFSIGMAFHEGRPGALPQNRAFAYPAFMACCAQDHAGCCNNQGIYLLNGWGGIRQDRARALTFFERACRLGDSVGCQNVSRNR